MPQILSNQPVSLMAGATDSMHVASVVSSDSVAVDGRPMDSFSLRPF